MLDSTDSIKGVEGRGIKYFESKLNSWDLCKILEEYLYKYGQAQGIFEFQKNYRLLHMLNCDQDFIREVGSIPLLQGIQEVPKKPDLITNQF